MSLSPALAVLLLLLLGATASAEPLEVRPAGQPEVRDVAADLEPLRSWFNEHRGKPRLIVLLSPT